MNTVSTNIAPQRPAAWEDKPLKELATFEKGHVVATQPHSGTGFIPYIGADSFTGRFSQFTDDHNATTCEPSDVVMLWDGERSGLCASGLSGAIGSTVARLRPREGVNGRFLYFQLAHHFAWIQAHRTGTGVPHVPKDLANLLRAPIPKEEDEQSRIAAVLDTVDDAIAKTEAVIAKLRQVRAGLLHDLLTRGLDHNGQLRDPIAHPEQFQDSPLGRIPKVWTIRRLDELSAVERGKFTPRPRNDPRYYGGEYPFLQTGDVANAAGDVITTFTQTLNEEGTTVSREFPTNTIVITIAANIADTALLGRPMYLTDSVVGAVVHPPNSPRYVQLCVRRAKPQLEARAPQTAQMNINLQDLRPLKIPVPVEPDEQHRIAGIYDSHTDSLFGEQACLAKLQHLKSGLMTDLLTGRVRVKVGGAA